MPARNLPRHQTEGPRLSFTCPFRSLFWDARTHMRTCTLIHTNTHPHALPYLQTYLTEDPRVAEAKERVNELEAELQNARNGMELGYTDPQVPAPPRPACWGPVRVASAGCRCARCIRRSLYRRLGHAKGPGVHLYCAAHRGVRRYNRMGAPWAPLLAPGLVTASPGCRLPPLCAQGAFHKASSVQLRNKMRTDDDEAARKACYEGLRSIGPFVAGAAGGSAGRSFAFCRCCNPLVPRPCVRAPNACIPAPRHAPLAEGRNDKPCCPLRAASIDRPVRPAPPARCCSDV